MNDQPTISRATVADAVRSLGLVPRDTRTVLIEPHNVRAEMFVRNSEGRIIFEHDQAKTEERIIDISG